jgi:transcription elongation GreA/GreB family factor
MEVLLATARVVESSAVAGETVQVGSTVDHPEEGAETDEVYAIVGAAEANPTIGRYLQRIAPGTGPDQSQIRRRGPGGRAGRFFRGHHFEGRVTWGRTRRPAPQHPGGVFY